MGLDNVIIGCVALGRRLQLKYRETDSVGQAIHVTSMYSLVVMLGVG